MKTHRLQTRKNRGFTLVEMMLVLGIIALLVGAGAVMFTDVLGTGKQGRAKADISTLTTALRTYEAQSLLLPTTEQGLNALIERPTGRSSPQSWSPVLKKMMVDPWGHPYHYRRPGTKDKGGFDIYSAGPDEQAETADDIGNWML
jgi:general secretion pathway protein G